jgi:TRAP-type C4-dicarboxylate transport system permease large subunit
MEMGQITPLIGVNIFVIAGVTKTVPLVTIFEGVMPFRAIEVIFIIILTVFTQIPL